MSSIDEKRVYDDAAGRETVYVAAGAGVAAVSVSGDIVGEFALAHRCAARDISGSDGRLAVATDEDVLVGDGETFDSTGFGPAVAVGFDGDTLLAGDPEGGVHRLADGDWHSVGSVEGRVRAIDGDLVAAESGVYRVGNDLRHVGLDDARDVAVDGFLAATGRGLYRLGNGWLDELDGDVRVVASDGERAHAATPDALYERRDGDWTRVETPVEEPVVGVAYGDAVYAVTDSGTFFADAGDGWRTRSLGLSGVRGLVVGGTRTVR
jgi:hypothetical protein